MTDAATLRTHATESAGRATQTLYEALDSVISNASCRKLCVMCRVVYVGVCTINKHNEQRKTENDYRTCLKVGCLFSSETSVCATYT
jgi:hypothetical protein